MPDMQANEVLTEARGLVLDAGGRRLVDGISLAVRPHRRLAIAGANGAGKTVLLRLLHGLLRPTQGQVLWRGRPLDRAARDRQAMVFQRPVLLRRSVRANLGFALAVRGIGGAERTRRECAALERARLTALARHPARLLSGGEQQRLAVVRALACHPELLLLDEPTASLDPASAQAVESLILDASAQGVTVVLITHDVGQILRLGEDLAFLHQGRLAEFGAAEERLDSPRSEALRAWREGRLYVGAPEERPGVGAQ